MIVRPPEVLAPAGDADSMRAAVRAGADAVYFGLQGFNARARAHNFDVAELEATLRYLHDHGVKGYVTLNTLVFDDELPSVEASIRACAAAGVDAVIVQDLGVLRMVRAIAPELPVHGSTQMTCTDAASVELAASLGARRVILARELSIPEIAAIGAQTDVELEVFVHGALCIAYSGQCLTSEAIGGRSANRGACAQACRLPYELLVDGKLRDLGDRAYLLSPQDLDASSVMPQLVEMGIASVKIEGRLKGPEYVAATTHLYRRAIDAAVDRASAPPVSVEERRTALQMYSRGSGVGFFNGVDHQHLVEGRACDHRGVLVGVAIGGRRGGRGRQAGGNGYIVVRASEPLARGDGLLVEGGYAGEGEIGGRVWAIVADGAEIDTAVAGQQVELWLGPDKELPEGLFRDDGSGGDGVRDDAGENKAQGYAGRRVWKTNDPARSKAVIARIEREPHKIAIDVRVSGAFGQLPVFEATSERGAVARVSGDAPVEQARKAALTPAALREKLEKLGETPFVLGALDVDLPAESILPISSVNRARRALVDALCLASHRPHAATADTYEALLAAAVPSKRPPPKGGLFVLCRTLEQAIAAIDAGADGVYLDFLELTGTGAAVRALRARGPVHITLTPPRIRKPGEEKIDKFLADLAPDAILVRGLGALHELAAQSHAATDAPKIERIGDFSLNVTNKLSAAEVLSRGLAAFTPSFDLDAVQLAALLDSPFGPYAEIVVHHPMPLFHMEHCVIAALLSDGRDHKTCGRPCDRHKLSLRDRAGLDHPVEADVGCRNTVFHAAAQSAAGIVEGAQKSSVRRFRVELVRESAAEVAGIVGAYRRLVGGTTTAAEVFRSLKTAGGYGVVRGSLRVLSG